MGPGDQDACEFTAPAERVPHPGFPDCIAELDQPMTLAFDGFQPGQDVVLQAPAPGGLIERGTQATLWLKRQAPPRSTNEPEP